MIALGFEPYVCDTEEEARGKMSELFDQKKWPVYFFESDTTGEKDFEEFYTHNESLVFDRFEGIGVILQSPDVDIEKLEHFEKQILTLRDKGEWTKADLVGLFNYLIPEFKHKETGKYLDNRM